MKKRKIIGLVMAASVGLNTVLVNTANADNIIDYNISKSVVQSDMPIVGQATGTLAQMEKWARGKGATETFVSLAKTYVNLGSKHGGVNPVMAYAQSALETGYGHYGGVIDESYKNPCGMKTKDGGGNGDKNAHMRFNSWEDGISAHLDHLALYAGASGYPRANTKDPRHFSFILGKAKTVNGLTGTWATDSSYSTKVLKLMAQINSIEGGGETEKPPVVSPEKPPVISPEKPEEVGKVGVVTASALNIRSGKGTNYSIKGRLKRGDKVTVVETSSGWHKIKYGNGYGYVSDDYIKLNENDNNQSVVPPTVDTTSKKGIVTASRLNIRNGRGTGHKVIGYLNRGVSVEIIDTANGWHKIKTGNGYGYVSDDYISIQNGGSQESGKTKTVTATVLNVRNGRGTGHKVIGSLKRGAKVEVLDSANGWYKIKHGSGHGYVSSQYLK